MLAPQRGFTLTELMVAGVISLIAVASVIAIYQTTATQTLRQLETAHLHSTAQSILALISADIRRAGFWKLNPARERLRHNPFQSRENTLQTGAKTGEAPDSCILFAYDLDKDGKLGTGQCPAPGCPPGRDADNVEQFGFRLNRHRLQMRYAGKGFSCQGGFWQALTDPSIVVTQFRTRPGSTCINLVETGSPCSDRVDRLLVRWVDISLVAHHRRTTVVTIDLQRRVDIRNDRFVAAGEPL